MANTSAFGGFMAGFASGYGTMKGWQQMDAKEKREESREKRAEEEHAQTKRIRELGIKKAELELPVLEKEIQVRGAKADFDLTEQGFLKEMQAFEQNTRRQLAQNRQRQAGMEGTELAAQQRNQPDELAVAREELNNKVLNGMKRQTANLWHVLKLGNKGLALDMYNDSQLVTPGEKAKDFRIEGEGDKKVLVVVPQGKGKERRIPVSALDALENQFGAKYEKVDNSILRIGRDGSIVPVYQADKFAHTGDGDIYSTRNGQIATQGINAGAGPGGGAGGAGGARPMSRSAEKHIDARVKMAIDKVIMPRFGGRFEGGLFFPDEANKDVATRATAIAGELIRGGMDPERAGVQAVQQAEREKAIRESGGEGGAGDGSGYTGPRPWKR